MTNKKVYYIEIEMDDAREALADATKKLEQLDAQLSGLDRNSDAAKKLVSEMAATAKQVQALTGEVEGLGEQLDNLKPGSVGALEAEVRELEQAWRRTVKGTREFDEALLALGRAQGELRSMEDAIDALNPKEKIPAFVDLANGIVGGFSIATAAATSWGGLSKEAADEVDASMQKLLVVMNGFEAISKATNSETLANVKNTWALAKSYLFASESASTASKVTRAALLATGVGAIVVLVGLLIANWDSLTAKLGGSAKFFTQLKAVASGVFEGILASLKNIGGVIAKLWDGDFSGAIAKAKNVGHEVAAGYAAGVQEVVDDGNRKLIAQQLEQQERLLKVQQAGGRESVKLQREILVNKLAVTKQGTDEEKKAHADAAAELAAFDAAQAKKRREDELALVLARMNARVALEQARGQESYKGQMQTKQQELAGLLAAETRNEAAITAKRGEIAAMQAQHAAEVAERRRASLISHQQNELALQEKQGKDTLALRLSFAEQLLAVDADGTEKARAQRDADFQALLLLQAEQNQREKAQREGFREQGREVEQAAHETALAFAKGAGEATTDAYLQGLAEADKKARQLPNLGRTILTNFFGVKPEDVEKVKAAFNEAFAEISQDVTTVVSSLLATGMQAADAQLQAVQARLQELDNQLSAASSKRQSDEEALKSATGARRTYLISQVEKERKAEAGLAAEKAKAAREEQAAQKARAKLEKEQQQISAASTAIEATLLAIKAAQVLVEIISKGKFGWDNIALGIAAAATIGTGLFAVKNAAKTFEDGTGALGSDGVLRGPRHSGGGIDLFGANGTYYGNAEGGEAITPVDATRNNGPLLEMIRTTGRRRPLTVFDFARIAQDATASVSIAPAPEGYYEPGGLLNKGAAPGSSYASVDAVGVLAARLDRQTALLIQLVGSADATAGNTARAADHAAKTADNTDEIKRKPTGSGPRSHQEIMAEQEYLAGIELSQSFATL